MKNSRFASASPPSLLIVPALLGCLLGACHDSDSSRGFPASVLEQEPNDTAAQAQALRLTQTGLGAVHVAGDVDFWSITLAAGQTVQVEIFGTRLDQATWDTANNIPRLTLYASDGTSKILEHDFGAHFSDGWAWGAHDLDFTVFRAPLAGIYFLAVTQDSQARAGGDYGVRVDEISLGTITNEVELAGTSGDNDTWDTAEAITPGVVAGFHVDEEWDFYSFEVTAPSIVRLTLTAHRNGVFGGDDAYYDPEMYLYDTDGTTLLYYDDDSYYYDSSIHYRIDTPGTYFVGVYESWVDWAGDAAYFLEYTSTPTAGAFAETEPNDDTGTAEAIAYGDLVEGTIDVGNTDFFSFTGTAGDMVRLQVFDADNYHAAFADAFVDFLATDGMTYLGTGGNSQLQVLTTILQESGTFFIEVTDSGTTTDYCFELTRFRAAAYETETNDAIVEADSLDANGLAAGVIDPALETDFFGFSAFRNVPTTISVYAGYANASDGFWEFSGHGSSLSPRLNVYDAGGTMIASSTNNPASAWAYTEDVVNGLPTAAVSFLPTASGTYFVEVLDTGASGGPDHYYVLEMR